MNEYYRYRRVCRLRGWTKWLPFLVAPFTVLFFEAWLHTSMREHDYTMGNVNSEIRVLEAKVEELKAQKADLERMENIQVNAAALGLQEPQPNQVKVVYLDGHEPTDMGEELIDLASLDLNSEQPALAGALEPLE